MMMMMSSKENLCVVLLISSMLMLMLMIIPSEASGAYFEKIQVIVRNGIEKENVTIHCYSSEDDLGAHVLSYGAEFPWHFRVNLWRTTKFYCDFATKHGSGNYGVYTSNVGEDCQQYCLWKVRSYGLCLQLKLKDKAGKPLYKCQDWKNP